MDEFSQYERKADDFSQYERKTPAAEPGWFEPGSKSETAMRTLSQGATFGMGDEAQAALRSAPELFQSGGLQKYLQSYRGLRDEERAATEASQAANPKTALASTLAGAILPGAGVVKAGKLAYAIPSTISKVAPATNAAIAAGAAGAAQGVLRGAGEASSEEPLLPAVAKQAALEGTVGSVVPGADSLMGRFVQNYKGLRPTVSAGIGPATIGGVIGGGASATGNLPSISRNIIDPAATRQETWASDPYTKALDTAIYTVGGAFGGKTVKDMARAGGAMQKTIAGEGVPGGVYSTPRGPLSAADDLGGGGMGGNKPPPQGPKAPEGMSPDDARKDGMAKAATVPGRAETNNEHPLRDAMKTVQGTANDVTKTSKSIREMMDEFGKWRGSSRNPGEPSAMPPNMDPTKPPTSTPVAPKPEGPTEWPRIFTPDELDQDLTAATLKGMSASKAPLPKLPYDGAASTPKLMNMTEDESMDALANTLRRTPIENLVREPDFGNLIDAFKSAQVRNPSGHPARQQTLDALNDYVRTKGYRDIQQVQEVIKNRKPK